MANDKRRTKGVPGQERVNSLIWEVVRVRLREEEDDGGGVKT